ncbi:MAG: hypothetical protein EBV06_09830, partial [Planctomycetia bacterium]|nr:hypothetical protein [Planctomycetia bacterium]
MRLLCCVLVCAATARADLATYVAKPDTSFAWKLEKNSTSKAATVYTLSLTSQTWQKIEWKHDLVVIVPSGIKPTDSMLLWNTGGTPSPRNTLLQSQLAMQIKAPVAFLYGIPQQPLFGGKREDALIAETFVRFLDTKDADWPLLFPMVKSLIKAMDALQAFSKQHLKAEMKQFVVSGASKRGWTSWLTAASDPRVKAVMPVVIDTLNFQKQMPHQLKSFGVYSDQIKDYTDSIEFQAKVDSVGGVIDVTPEQIKLLRKHHGQKFRVEIIENIYSLIFLMSNHFKDEDDDQDDNQDEKLLATG